MFWMAVFAFPYTYGLFFYFNGSDKTSFSTSDEVSSAAAHEKRNKDRQLSVTV
jgi:hypothetical protein